MRYTKGLMAVALMLILGSVATAYNGTYVPGNGINNTPHDLGTAKNGMNYTAVPADPQTRICIFCHAPHNTYRPNGTLVGAGPTAPDPAYDYLPLWNHELPSVAPTYTPYDPGPGAPQNGPKASQAFLNGSTVNNVSLLCLSCHDGSIAVNSYGNSSQPVSSHSTGNTMISPQYVIGQDQYLGNHHPIGFDYDLVQAADTEIRSADVAMMTPSTFVRDHLFSNTLQCASCHSVHNTGNNGEMLLWRSDQNSELCLTCHAKGIYTAP